MKCMDVVTTVHILRAHRNAITLHLPHIIFYHFYALSTYILEIMHFIKHKILCCIIFLCIRYNHTSFFPTFSKIKRSNDCIPPHGADFLTTTIHWTLQIAGKLLPSWQESCSDTTFLSALLHFFRMNYPTWIIFWNLCTFSCLL